jgi:hypothetical protein
MCRDSVALSQSLSNGTLTPKNAIFLSSQIPFEFSKPCVDRHDLERGRGRGRGRTD